MDKVRAYHFLAVKKYKDGGEAVIEHFESQDDCVRWIAKQKPPTDDSWRWYVGEFDHGQG